jgi:hypothetical protein
MTRPCPSSQQLCKGSSIHRLKPDWDSIWNFLRTGDSGQITEAEPVI